MDIMRHKDAVDDILKSGKAIMNSKSPEEKEILKVKTLFKVNESLTICEQVKRLCGVLGQD